MPQIGLLTLLELVGDLHDSTEPGQSASGRFRKYLGEHVQHVKDVRAYVDDALAHSGDQFGKSLQDLINHIGELLGFEVAYGRYRGVKNDIGFDGLWRSQEGWAIVVETKTTDVYSIKTATVLGYINSLISEGQIENPGSVLGLYVYGRFDAQANQLENAIIAEGRRERLRVVSVDALLNLLALKQEYDLSHDAILGLLLPAPVKVDALVNLIFDIVDQEKEESETYPEITDNHVEPSKLVAKEPTQKNSNSISSSPSENYTGKTVKAIIFQDRRCESSTWKESALALCEELRRHNPDKFKKTAVELVGRKRPYISHDRDKLRKPEPIPNTPLFFETNLSANSMVRLCYRLITQMGYDESALQFEVET